MDEMKSSSSDQSLPLILTEKWKLEVIRMLSDKPTYAYTIRELSLKTSGSYTAVRNFVYKLHASGVVDLTKKGGSIFVRYIPKNPYRVLLRELTRPTALRLEAAAKKYAERLFRQENERIFSIILFGSVARGTATESSDIDILILTRTDAEKDKISTLSRPLAEEIGTEEGVSLIPIVESKREFRNAYAHGERFEHTVKEEGKVLAGDEIDERML